MAMAKIAVLVTILSVFTAVSNIPVISSQTGMLSENFYESTCKNLESIVNRTVVQKYNENPNTVPGILRLYFHDCIVRGCDASVLIASTPNNEAERDASDNLSLSGDAFDAIQRVKKAVEDECPGVVSCADILSITTRDLVGLVGGPFWRVEKGRRDGIVSRAGDIPNGLPHANFNVDQMLSLFQRNGLSLLDLVALSGAHTIGFAHCKEFANRIYNFSANTEVDPSMDPNYAAGLRSACPKDVDPTIVVVMDLSTPARFDNFFYKNLVAHRGLLTTDQVLYSDRRTAGYVRHFSKKNGFFADQFANSMVKLGRLGVLTGNEGEIRRNCFSVN